MNTNKGDSTQEYHQIHKKSAKHHAVRNVASEWKAMVKNALLHKCVRIDTTQATGKWQKTVESINGCWIESIINSFIKFKDVKVADIK